MTVEAAATELVRALSTFEGVEPKNIRAIRLTPRSIEVEIYETNAGGEKFIDADGNVALCVRRLPYRYLEETHVA